VQKPGEGNGETPTGWHEEVRKEKELGGAKARRRGGGAGGAELSFSCRYIENPRSRAHEPTFL